jgi:hypothetical protein
MTSFGYEPEPTLFGRHEAIQRIMEVVTGDGPPVVVMGGAPGIGRTAVLAAVRARCAAAGVGNVVHVRVTRADRSRRYAVLYRIDAELNEPRDGYSGVGRLLGHSDADPHAARRVAVALADSMRGRGRLVVLVDDAQWVDAHSRGVLQPVAQRLVGSEVTLVCAVRTAAGSRAGREFSRLRRADLATVGWLRPLDVALATELIADRLDGRMSPEVMAWLHGLTRGVPGALLAAAQGYLRSGTIRMIAGHGYVVDPHRPPDVPWSDPLYDDVRRLPERARDVVVALSMFVPLGGAASGLIARHVGLTDRQVDDVLSTLATAGVLRRHPRSGGWRFRMPLLERALPQTLGPYARRRLAQAAVQATWDGTARPADRAYVADLITVAGKLVDRDRAIAELFAMATEVVYDDSVRAQRWLGATIDLATGDEHLLPALLAHCDVSMLLGRWTQVLDSAQRILDSYLDRLPPAQQQQVVLTYLMSLRALGDEETLTELVRDSWRRLPGGTKTRIVTRAFALYLLNRHGEAYRALLSTRAIWDTEADVTAGVGRIFVAVCGFLLGLSGPDQLVATAIENRPPPEARTGQGREVARVAALARALLVVDDRVSALAVMTGCDLPERFLSDVDQVMLEFLRGEWDGALDRARLAVACGTPPGAPMGFTGMYRALARIHLARGRVTHARELVEQARSEQPVLDHLLNSVESDIDAVLGDLAEARKALTDGLALAEREGLVVGTDELLLRLTEVHVAEGAPDAAQEAMTMTGRAAARVGTAAAKLNHLLARVVAVDDGAAATEALGLARELGQPYQLANTIAKVSGKGWGTTELVREAYGIYGDLGALLPRAHLRRLMRMRNITVSNRGTTVAENGRLLATLVTEGLSNKRLAVILNTSEKGVEGQLSRLFKNTGYRSRVELATALLTGQFDAR